MKTSNNVIMSNSKQSYIALGAFILSVQAYGGSMGPFGSPAERPFEIEIPDTHRISRIVVGDGRWVNSLEVFISETESATRPPRPGEISLGRVGGSGGTVKDKEGLEIPLGRYLSGIAGREGDDVVPGKVLEVGAKIIGGAAATIATGGAVGPALVGAGAGVIDYASNPHTHGHIKHLDLYINNVLAGSYGRDEEGGRPFTGRFPAGYEIYKITGNVAAPWFTDGILSYLKIYARPCPEIIPAPGSNGDPGGDGMPGGVGGIGGHRGSIIFDPALPEGDPAVLPLIRGVRESNDGLGGPDGTVGLGGRGGTHGRDFRRTRRGFTASGASNWIDAGISIVRALTAAPDGRPGEGTNSAGQERPASPVIVALDVIRTAYEALFRDARADPLRSVFLED